MENNKEVFIYDKDIKETILKAFKEDKQFMREILDILKSEYDVQKKIERRATIG